MRGSEPGESDTRYRGERRQEGDRRAYAYGKLELVFSDMFVGMVIAVACGTVASRSVIFTSSNILYADHQNSSKISTYCLISG